MSAHRGAFPRLVKTRVCIRVYERACVRVKVREREYVSARRSALPLLVKKRLCVCVRVCVCRRVSMCE